MLLTTEPNPARRIIFALDYPGLELARAGAELVHTEVGVLRIGLELLAREGAAALRIAQGLGLGPEP